MSVLAQAFRNIGGALRRGRPTVAGVERRAMPRISKRLSVDVAGHTLTSTSVSDGGLQVSCPERWLRALDERWDRAATAVRIELPGGEPIEVTCEVTYVSECDDEYLIGLKFREADERARVLWQAYLTRLGELSPGMGGTA